MKIITNKSFANREELDAYVRSTHGENPTKNKDLTIEATDDELTRLSLDEKTTVHGVKVRKNADTGK